MLGLAVVIATDSDHARAEAGELVSVALRERKGVLLQPDSLDDGLLGANIPFQTVEPMTGRGRGLWCWEGAACTAQVILGPPGSERIE
jgi:S-DNA-T family DNA segregation ATPase FtsK/SpoIIIE